MYTMYCRIFFTSESHYQFQTFAKSTHYCAHRLLHDPQYSWLVVLVELTFRKCVIFMVDWMIYLLVPSWMEWIGGPDSVRAEKKGTRDRWNYEIHSIDFRLPLFSSWFQCVCVFLFGTFDSPVSNKRTRFTAQKPARTAASGQEWGGEFNAWLPLCLFSNKT